MVEERKPSWKVTAKDLLTILGVVAVFYFMPSLSAGIVNFFKLVVFGDTKFSEFSEHWYKYSFKEVDWIYQCIADWFGDLLERLKS